MNPNRWHHSLAIPYSIPPPLAPQLLLLLLQCLLENSINLLTTEALPTLKAELVGQHKEKGELKLSSLQASQPSRPPSLGKTCAFWARPDGLVAGWGLVQRLA